MIHVIYSNIKYIAAVLDTVEAFRYGFDVGIIYFSTNCFLFLNHLIQGNIVNMFLRQNYKLNSIFTYMTSLTIRFGPEKPETSQLNTISKSDQKS